MTSGRYKRSLPLSKTLKRGKKQTRWRAPNAMYITRRAIGVMNALTYFQKRKLRGRKTARNDGKLQTRKVDNSIPKLENW